MIIDVLPNYYEKFEDKVHYSILRSMRIDDGNGQLHEVAWMKADVEEGATTTTPPNKYGLYCECTFTEDVGWSITPDGERCINFVAQFCRFRRAAHQVRLLELAEEYRKRFNVEFTWDFRELMQNNLFTIVLDLIKKAEANEWVEECAFPRSYGAFFFRGTVAEILGLPSDDVREKLLEMEKLNLVNLFGALVYAYTPILPNREDRALRTHLLKESEARTKINYAYPS